MIIPSSLDITQFNDENGQFTDASRQKLLEYTDEYYGEMAENKPRVSASVCIMKGRINEKLQERRKPAYDDLLKLIKSEDYTAVEHYDAELHRFFAAARIYEMERGGKDATVFEKIDYIDDFEKLFRQLVFYFRRIQMGMSKPVISELMTFIRTKKLSACAVTQVLYDCELGGKEIVAAKISELYQEQGSKKEALFVLNMALQSCRPEYYEYIDSRRRILMESIDA